MLDRTSGLVVLLLVVMALAPTARAEVRPEARLTPPSKGQLNVAFLISRSATIIDFTGPWEVFQDVMIFDRGDKPQDTHPFRLYTVAETREPIVATGGMKIVPNYTFDDAPKPNVIVIPAQAGSPGMAEWLKKASAEADLTMSVCTGAFQLAAAGLLDGRKATTHHDYYGQLQSRYPAVDVQHDLRWVESKRIATAGGLTSGIDMALRAVARYFGEDVAERTAGYMEHSGDGFREAAGLWDATDAASAREISAKRIEASRAKPVLNGLDPVLLARGERTPGKAALIERRGRYTYAFSSEETHRAFLADPAAFEIQLEGRCAAMSSASPGSGDPERFLVHDGRIYIFAGQQCQEAFRQDPQRYLN